MSDFRLTLNNLGNLVNELTKILSSSGKPYRVTVKEWRESRSKSQNALYWVWLSEIGKQYPLNTDSAKMKQKDLWHEVFKHWFCPAKRIYNNKAELIIKSTTALDVGEMHHYLNRIEGWCIDRGIMLEIPESSEYHNLKKKQEE